MSVNVIIRKYFDLLDFLKIAGNFEVKLQTIAGNLGYVDGIYFTAQGGGNILFIFGNRLLKPLFIINCLFTVG